MKAHIPFEPLDILAIITSAIVMFSQLPAVEVIFSCHSDVWFPAVIAMNVLSCHRDEWFPVVIAINGCITVVVRV